MRAQAVRVVVQVVIGYVVYGCEAQCFHTINDYSLISLPTTMSLSRDLERIDREVKRKKREKLFFMMHLKNRVYATGNPASTLGVLSAMGIINESELADCANFEKYRITIHARAILDFSSTITFGMGDVHLGEQYAIEGVPNGKGSGIVVDPIFFAKFDKLIKVQEWCDDKYVDKTEQYRLTISAGTRARRGPMQGLEPITGQTMTLTAITTATTSKIARATRF